MIQCSRLVRISGGVSGWHMRRLYLAVVVPRMLYGAGQHCDVNPTKTEEEEGQHSRNWQPFREVQHY